MECITTSGKLSSKLSVALPGSLVADTPHLREKTAKLGLVARACSIFGVGEVILYPDDAKQDQGPDLRLCAQILSFIETPQYLRKRLFNLSPTFQFAGILPPLQIPSHQVPRSIKDCKQNDIREGVVVNRRGDALEVEVGLERTLECKGDLAVGTRVTVQVIELGKNLMGEIIDPSKISIYWGFQVRLAKFSLGSLLEKERFDLKIGTSRYGTNVFDVWSKITDSIKNVSLVLIAFGSPRLGLREVLGQEGRDPSKTFDFFINTVPQQHVATVRTEEALLTSLALLNIMWRLE